MGADCSALAARDGDFGCPLRVRVLRRLIFRLIWQQARWGYYGRTGSKILTDFETLVRVPTILSQPLCGRCPQIFSKCPADVHRSLISLTPIIFEHLTCTQSSPFPNLPICPSRGNSRPRPFPQPWSAGNSVQSFRISQQLRFPRLRFWIFLSRRVQK